LLTFSSWIRSALAPNCLHQPAAVNSQLNFRERYHARIIQRTTTQRLAAMAFDFIFWLELAGLK